MEETPLKTLTIHWSRPRGHKKLRIVPHFGPTTEQKGKIVSTPERQGKIKKQRKKLMAAFSMSDTQQSVLSLSFVDKKGNPAPTPAGTVTWLVDNAAMIALTPAADNLSCVAASVGPLGTATISVKVSAPDGTTLAAGSIDATITGGTATTINVTAGAPTEQP